MNTEPRRSLAAILELVIGAESGSRLLEAVAMLLGPGSKVWLADTDADVFYCPDGDEDLPLTVTLSALPAHAQLCLFRGEVVAMLVSAHPDAAIVAQVLGPALVGKQVHEAILSRLDTAEEKSRLLIEAGELLQEFDLETVLVKSLQSALTAVRAEIGALQLLEGEGDAAHLVTRVAWGLREDHLAALRLRDGVPLAQAAMAEGTTHAFDRVRLASEVAPEALAGVSLTSLLVVPLIVGRRSLGAVFLVNAAKDFDAQDREMAEAACRLAAIAVDNARLVAMSLAQQRIADEMNLAQKVQRRIFPAGTLECGGIVISGRSIPCTETGGDYYQYREIDGRIAVMIGDVSGHGIGAALYTTMAHAALLQALSMGLDVATTFTTLNRGLESSSLDDSYMTAFLLILDPITRRFSYTNAGHDGIFHVHADGKVVRLSNPGLPLGMMSASTYEAFEGVLAPGDCLVLLTDGLAECWNPQDEQFGLDRLEACAQQNRGLGAEAQLEAFVAAVNVWANGRPFLDDVTVMVVRG